jgi:hypothetical protein
MSPDEIKNIVSDVIENLDPKDREAYEEHLEELAMERKTFDPNAKVTTLPFVESCHICQVILTDLREDDESWGIKGIATHFKDAHQFHLTIDPTSALAETGLGWPDPERVPDSSNL